MQLYTRATSSCSFRIRIALALKQLQYESVYTKHADQRTQQFMSMNPQKLVPLFVNGSDRIAQSIPIMEYLDEKFGTEKNPLLPAGLAGRARVRAISQYIISEIQPLQSTRVDAELKRLNVDEKAWKKHWITLGFQRLEAMLSSPETGKFCHGDAATMADCCLIPQVWNANNRYDVHSADYPAIDKIYKHCVSLPAFAAAMPEAQEDYSPPLD